MLLEGVVAPLPRRSARTSRIIAAVAYELRRRARPPCGVLIAAGLRLSEDTCVQADAAVTCEDLGATHWMQAPLLIAEVISPSAQPHGLALKLPAYQKVVTLREIWAIDGETRSVRLRCRVGEDWLNGLPVRGGTFRSEALEDTIALDELYAGTDL